MFTKEEPKDDSLGLRTSQGTISVLWGIPEAHEEIEVFNFPIDNIPAGTTDVKRVFSRKEIAKVLVYDHRFVREYVLEKSKDNKLKLGFLLSIKEK